MNRFRDLLPPFLVRWLLRLGFGGNKFRYGFSSWEDAAKKANGYDEASIVNSIRHANAMVRDGQGTYERDGIVFDTIQYSWPLLASLLATPTNANVLSVLDWGGSLGSSYRQNRNFLLKAGLNIRWTIIEQPRLAEIGAQEFSNNELSFRTNFDGIVPGDFDVVLFASSICYVPNFQEIISTVMELRPSRIIFDRTPQNQNKQNKFGIQIVGKRIYKATYPIVSFGKGFLEDLLSPKYELIETWVCDLQPDPLTESVGLFFALRD